MALCRHLILAKRVEYLLGSNISCNESNYCNPPLKPNTLYCVKFRGFTENGFCDTDLIKFHTSKCLLCIKCLSELFN